MMSIEWYFETICFPSLHQLYDAYINGSIEKDLAMSLAGAMCIIDESYDLKTSDSLKEKVEEEYYKFCNAIR